MLLYIYIVVCFINIIVYVSNNIAYIIRGWWLDIQGDAWWAQGIFEIVWGSGLFSHTRNFICIFKILNLYIIAYKISMIQDILF